MAKSNKKQIGRSLFNLRKNKGSVLFLIVAIMSVMVILASALYYSLSTARRQVEVKYDSQQAYQSALALNDLVVNFINIKNVFHTCYKFCICFVWKAPVLAAVRSKPIFFKVLRIASRLIGSSNSIFA